MVYDGLGLPHNFLEHPGWTDTVCLCVLLVSACGGILRGFSREITSLLVWVGAGWTSVYCTGFFLTFLPAVRGLPGGFTGAYLIVFIVSMLLLNIAARQIASLGRDVLSGGMDIMLGIGFGLVRGYILLIVAGLFMSWAAADWLSLFVKGSVFAPYILHGMNITQGYLPENFMPYLRTITAYSGSGHLAFPVTTRH